jgi:L-asparagine permease
MPPPPSMPEPAADKSASVSREDEGYHHDLSNRQMQMIAIGGAIGTGLFMGAGARLAHAGPGLFLIYGICGGFVFLILRALGELVLHRPASGSFVSYAREFFGEKAAFVAGWMYFLNWAMAAIVDSTAIASYFHYWGAFQAIPQWTLALIALVAVVSLNLISVKAFGEFEFWAALIKVIALTTFLVVGIVFLAGRFKIQGNATGPSLWAHHGGFLPTGLLPLVLVTSGVIFAYAGVELVGTAAGETAEPEKVMPRAINSVIARIAVFYCGSVLLLAVLLPYTTYKAGESPFVTFFSHIGFEGGGTLMNVVVLTAAFSSLNAGLYSTGRILRSMSVNGSGPKFTGRMSKNGVPYGGILLTATIGLLGVGLNMITPEGALEIALNIAAIGVLAAWATIVLCHLRFYRLAQQGTIQRPHFQMPWAPYSGYATLVFLVGVLVLMALDPEKGPWVIAALVAAGPALIGGWFLVRDRVSSAAEEGEPHAEVPELAPE